MKTTVTVTNQFTGRTTTVSGQKQIGFAIVKISAKQFERVIAALGHGPIAGEEYHLDAYKRNGNFHGAIETRG